ncbi:hypothetical protein [Limosilactobacillus galli]|uniref:hypothetical protein n=1 Tax=Limosilactobacillus galli TaxID=2991834 RepID=UPI0024BA35DA|nr:hypothetical protein [Limosilactobacillus galli]
MKKIQSNDFGTKLNNLDSHLNFEIVTKDETNAELNGDFLQLRHQEAGDVIVKYADDPVLAMVEVENTPVIKLEVAYVDKLDSKMFADLIKLCGEYLPESGDSDETN